MARIRFIDDEQRTSPASRDNSRFRVCVVWAPGRDNFTYHYVAGPRQAARYLRLPGPTAGAMAAFFQERQDDGSWEDWYDGEGRDIEEAIEEGAAL